MFELRTPFLIGMAHLPPLPGSVQSRRSIDSIVQGAVRDAAVLETAGFDGVIIENFGDVPFSIEPLDPARVATMAIVAARVRKATSLRIGVNVLRNDARAALGIAVAAEADFIRVNVHTGVSATDQGWVEGRAAETLAYRDQLGADVGIFADVHVKHAKPVSQPDIKLAAEETAYRGLADVLIVSGSTTGRGADEEQIRQVKEAVPDRPVLVGSGAQVETVTELLQLCDGVIVGTDIKEAGRPDRPVDPDRAAAFVKAARG